MASSLICCINVTMQVKFLVKLYNCKSVSQMMSWQPVIKVMCGGIDILHLIGIGNGSRELICFYVKT